MVELDFNLVEIFSLGSTAEAAAVFVGMSFGGAVIAVVATDGMVLAVVGVGVVVAGGGYFIGSVV